MNTNYSKQLDEMQVNENRLDEMSGKSGESYENIDPEIQKALSRFTIADEIKNEYMNRLKKNPNRCPHCGGKSIYYFRANKKYKRNKLGVGNNNNEVNKDDYLAMLKSYLCRNCDRTDSGVDLFKVCIDQAKPLHVLRIMICGNCEGNKEYDAEGYDIIKCLDCNCIWRPDDVTPSKPSLITGIIITLLLAISFGSLIAIPYTIEMYSLYRYDVYIAVAGVVLASASLIALSILMMKKVQPAIIALGNKPHNVVATSLPKEKG